MTEQNAFDQVFGNRAAVDDDEGLVLARAVGLDGARDQLLADTGFAFDQDRNICEDAALRISEMTRSIAGLPATMPPKPAEATVCPGASLLRVGFERVAER
jgi:hypothetical protein